VTSSSQGVGNFLNTGILLILLCIFDVTTVANQKAHPNRLGGVWRTAFGIGLIPIVAIIFYRVVYLRVSILICCMLFPDAIDKYLLG
jgi:hypothetical protein